MLLEIGSAEGVALNLSVTVSTFRSPRAAPLGGLHLSVLRLSQHRPPLPAFASRIAFGSAPHVRLHPFWFNGPVG